jgi:hypothetical protein
MKNIIAITLLTMIWTAQADAKEILYADILANPSKYVGKTVTMSGVFAYTEPMRGSFTFNQNDDLIEAFYGDLPQKDKDLIVSQRQDSKTAVVVTGIVQRYTNIANKYFMNASSLQIAGGVSRSASIGSSLLYSVIQSNPSKYVGKTVTMSGVFAYTEPMRGSFTFDQNGDLIEVFYGDLPQKDKDLIASQKREAKTPVIVTGIVQRYTNGANKYFINASSVSMQY